MSNWISETRLQSALLFRTLVVYCEEHLTVETHKLVPHLQRALQLAISAKVRNYEAGLSRVYLGNANDHRHFVPNPLLSLTGTRCVEHHSGQGAQECTSRLLRAGGAFRSAGIVPATHDVAHQGRARGQSHWKQASVKCNTSLQRCRTGDVFHVASTAFGTV